VRQLEVRDLELHPFAADHRPLFAPIKLERLTWRKHQRHERSTAGNLRRFALLASPLARKRRHSVVRPPVTERHQIGEHLPQVAPLLAALARLRLQPLRQLGLESAEFADACSSRIGRLDRLRIQVLAQGVAR
jgi:hypothetical protein